jgi:hypothetical protein
MNFISLGFVSSVSFILANPLINSISGIGIYHDTTASRYDIFCTTSMTSCTIEENFPK